MSAHVAHWRATTSTSRVDGTRPAAAAAVSLDVLSMLGYALFTAVLLVIANLIVDVMYAVLDPRVRLS